MRLQAPASTTFAHDPSLDLGFLGFWRCDFKEQTVQAAPDVNRLFGLCIEHEERLPLALYGLRIHPDDLQTLTEDRKSCVGPSGHGVIEYRVIDESGNVRWLMCRGLYEVDRLGELVSGCGMLIDITAFKADATGVREPSLSPLAAIADLLIEAYKLAKAQPNESVRSGVAEALLRVARAIAQGIEPDLPN